MSDEDVDYAPNGDLVYRQLGSRRRRTWFSDAYDEDRPCVMHPADDCSASIPCEQCPQTTEAE